MSNSAAPMADEDIFAFRPAPEAAPPAPPPRRPHRVWPWLLAGFASLMLLLAAAGVSLLVSLMNSAYDGWHVIVNGEPWAFDALDGLGLLPVLGVAVLALLLVTVIVPLSLLLALLGVVLGLGLALAGVVLVVALALSPLWLLVLLLWLLLRRKPAATVRP